MTEGVFTILVVCSGNICRSPVAEQLLRDRLSDVPGVQVHSAGTIARPGVAMTDQAVELSQRYGGHPEGHLSRPLTAALIEGSDLVLTAERSHRADVARLHPRASRFAFTLTQFARMIDSIEPEALARIASPQDLVAAAAARRGYVQASSPEADDIADPYRRSQAVYDTAGAAIDTATASIAAAFPRPGA